MINRVLLIALTSIAACGLGTGAIAREPRLTDIGKQSDQEILISQSDDNDSSGTQASSPAIQALQDRLRELGYYDGAIDGVFGVATRDALAAFQRDNNLVGTGILDPLTQERLANSGEGSPESDAAAGADESGAPPSLNDGDSPLADLPPVNEDGEAQTEIETPALEETPSTADGEAAPAPTAEDATSAATPADNNNVGRLIVIGLAIVGLGALGAGAVLWFIKRGQSKTTSTINSGLSGRSPSNNASAPHTERATTSSPPPSRSTAAMANQNGSGARVPTPESSTLTPQQQSALDVRHQAASLANSAEPKVAKINIIDELIHDLAQPNAEQRRKAIWELGQRGNSAAVQPLVNLLEQSDSHEQSLILAALAEIGIKTLRPINRGLVIGLQSENTEVRKNAIRDLTRIYGALNQVGRSLGHASAIDDDPEVRQTADWALDQLNRMRLNVNDSAGRLKDGAASQDKKTSAEDE
ncbi:MAG: peptidoglycan-binding protein [Cyanobacteria bacterium P01_C01_bin.120]